MGKGRGMSTASGIDKDWQARSDMESLQRAQEIMGDARRMKAAQAAAVKQVKSLLPVAGGIGGVKKAAPTKASGNRLAR